MEGGARPGESDPVLREERRRGHRVEGLGGEQPTAGHQSGEQPPDATDVGEGEDERRHVVGADVETLGHGQRGRHDREIAVRRALRIRGGARGVEEPPDRRVRRRRGQGVRIGEATGVGVGQCTVDDQHLHPRPSRRDLLGHRREVEAPEGGGHDEQGRPALLGDEADLAPAVDGDDRVLARTESCEGADQDQRLVPGGELPAHRGVSTNPVLGLETCRGAETRVAVAGEGELGAGVLVGEHRVGCGRGAALDELPEARRADPAPSVDPL